ncbi:DUF4349 domain-containing protein [Mucilaginibacter antarcticus]|uniref:DUF4349 domain-containing protein n=1 Tax=Mucilaginibacter antarcticus TaxID=1855725 RepID=A0ABW5XNH0_9SPHI
MKAKILIMLAGIGMLAACKGRGNYSAESAITDSVKLVKTADMRIKVKDVQSVAERISKLTLECGGMVTHNNQQANTISQQDLKLSDDSVKRLTVFNRTADLTLKMPTQFLEPFMDSLNHLGIYVDARKLDIEDRTIDYAETELKAENRKESAKVRSKIKLTQAGADTLLALKDEFVDKKIANMRTDQAAYFSTLSLNLYENNAVHAEVIVNDDLGAYNTPVSTRIGLALSNGWRVFGDVMVGLLNLWVFILAIGGLWYAVICYRRKRKVVKAVV